MKLISFFRYFIFIFTIQLPFNALLYETNNDIVPILTIPLLTIGNNLYKLNLTIGNPPQTLSNVFYDTQSFESVIAGWDCFNCRGGRFNHENSSTVNMTNIPTSIYNQAKKYNVKGLYFSDQFLLENGNHSNNTFFVKIERFSPDYTIIDYDGILGFGYKYDKTLFREESSVINMLMKANRIKRKIIVQELGYNDGKLYLGGIPQAIFNQINSNYSSCSIPNDLTIWGCDISSVYLGDKYDLNQGIIYNNEPTIAIFSTLEPFIIAPYNSINFFIKEYFNNNTNCQISEISAEISSFKCNNETNFTQDINIVINSALYKLQLSDHFTEKTDTKMFNIYFSKETNNWIFGQIFLKNYQVVFDGENASIGFYGGFRYFFIPSKFWMWFTIISLIIGFISLVFLIFLIREYKKTKRGNEYVLERNESIKI